MSQDEIIVEIARAVGRIEARLDGQDNVLAEVRTDVAALKAKPGVRWASAMKWAGSIVGTVIAAVVLVKLGVRR